MNDYNLKKLQNGSDIRGISLTGVGGSGVPNLRDAEACLLSKGFLLWLCNKTGKKPDQLTVTVGRDPRMSGQMLLYGIINGLAPYGVKVLDCGLASTPAMFMSTVFDEIKADGAIMITASHLPYERNGFKYFTADGGLDKKDISQIIEFAEADGAGLGAPQYADNTILVMGKKTYPSEQCGLMELYCNHLRQLIIDGVGNGPTPLAGLKITVDAGNGSGGFFARDVLAPLGADISSSQYLEADGTFPNHAPNPEDKEALASICMKVISTGADFGLIFDTDVDRSAAVDGRGREIARNGIVAMAAALVAEKHPGTTVVTDSITSTHLTDFIENKLGMKHLRFKRGYKNVINKGIELNNAGQECWLAIETSGHAALKENYFLDDGAYLATKIVIKAARLAAEGKTLDSVIDTLKTPLEARELRFPITCGAFAEYADNILTELEQWATEQPDMQVVTPNFEGVRIAFDEGWCLLRKSLHDPMMPFNVESDRQGGADEIISKITGFLSRYSYLTI